MRIRNSNKIYQITFLTNLFPVNCYLYEESSSLTLIDIGTGHFCKTLLRLSRELNKPITKIVLTHPHQDHVAGLDTIAKELPDVDIYISERDYVLLKGDFNLYSHEEKKKIRGGFIPVETNPNNLVKDGGYIGTLRVISTPGHTPGSISLYDEEAAILIVGDALQVKGGFSVAGDKRLFFPFPALATWSVQKSIQSAKKLYSLDIAVLGTGHGNLLMNPKEKLLKIIQRAENKLKYEKN